MLKRLPSLLMALTTAAWSQNLSGLWNATVETNGLTIPFRIELTASADSAQGSFFNGDQKVTSTAGTFEKGTLRLDYDYMGTRLIATMDPDGTLHGDYGREGRL